MGDNFNKYNAYAFLTFVAMVLTGGSSSIYTYQLFSSSGEDIYSIVSGIIGLCIDLGKYLFSSGSVFAYNKRNYTNTLIFGILACICIAVSFFASQGRDLNYENKLKNESIKNSDEYTQTKDIYTSNADDIKTLNKEIQELKDNKNKYIKDSSKSERQDKDNMPSDWVTKKLAKQEEINNIEQAKKEEIEQIIKDKEAEVKALKNYQNEISFSDITVSEKSEDGFFSIAMWFAKNNEEEAEILFPKIVMYKNLLLEIIGVAFSLLLGFLTGKSDFKFPKLKNKKVNLEKTISMNEVPDEIVEKDDYIFEKPKENEIILQDNLKYIDVLKYLDVIYNPANQSNRWPVPGYKKVAKLTSLKEPYCHKIHGLLEIYKILGVEKIERAGNATMNKSFFLVNSKEEAIKIIQNKS